MKIAYISYELPPDTGYGGIGTYTYLISKLMVKLGCEVTVFAASNYRNSLELEDGVYIHRIKVKNISEFRNKVSEKFAEENLKKCFDIIECAEIGASAYKIKENFPDIPLVIRLHTPAVLITKLQNTYLPFLKKFRFVASSILRGRLDLGFWSNFDKNRDQDLDYLITKKADSITAPSFAIKNWAVNFWQLDHRKINVISNPPPESKFFVNSSMINTKRITFIGRLNVVKGVVNLTKAIPMVLKKNPDWKFRFIGKSDISHIKDKEMKSWVLEYLKDYKESVEIIEGVESSKIIQYYNDTEICVFPSLFESFSYVCAEAMASGKAIVASKFGGMSELLSKGNGKLVNPYKVKELANAINELIANPDLRRNYEKCARERLLNEFDVGSISNKMLTHYHSVIQQSS